MASIDTLIREFVAQQKEWLELEITAEQDEVGDNKTDQQQQHGTSSSRAVALRQLEASDISVGLYGRTVVQLTAISASNNNNKSAPLLPAHRFTVGDDVEIRSKHHQTSKRQRPPHGGVISAVTDTCISVALFQKQTSNNSNDDINNDEDELLTPPLTLIPKSSVEVHRKIVAGLAELERHGIQHPIAGTLVEALFARTKNELSTASTSTTTASSTSPVQRFNDGLDDSQWEAIEFALSPEQRVALIHGPPGTGKTTTVAELIQQAVYHHGMKVLVCAPSNVAVDNVLERLAEARDVYKYHSQAKTTTATTSAKKTPRLPPLRMVRLGHPARIKPSIIKFSLEALVQRDDGTQIVQDVRRELQQFLRILNQPKSSSKGGGHKDKRMAYREVKSLRQEVRQREEQVVQQLLKQAQVVLATTVGAASRLLRMDYDSPQNAFDLVIIDEAAQALEASCWIPILKGRRKLVLAGDHCQLPPTIMCQQSHVVKGLSRTLFERLMELYGDHQRKSDDAVVSRMLRVQYRMHQDIANWASQAMYHSELITHDSVATRTLSQLVVATQQQQSTVTTVNDDLEQQQSPSVTRDPTAADMALLLIDTAGCDMYESENASGSRYNQGEAQVVAKHVQTLVNTVGISQEQIAIITPYNGQVEILKNLLLPDYPKLEIRSVDGFQGGEREAVVLSLVRSSEPDGKRGAASIGFLRDDRRLNVAVTRAKRHCALICDSDTVSLSKFVKNLISWMEEHGEQRSAIEFLQDDGTEVDQDLRDAEIEMRRAMADLARQEAKEARQRKKNHRNTTDDATKRKAVLDKIALFSENGRKGDEMALSSELTSFDRRVIHEFAEQIGLGHRSEGIDGKDRRIILVIEKELKPPPAAVVAPTNDARKTHPTEVKQSNDTFLEPPTAPATSFAALALDDSDSDSDIEAKEEEVEVKTEAVTARVDTPTTNQLLADLAKERSLRALPGSAGPETITTGPSKNKKKNKKGQQKLGSGSKVAATSKVTERGDENLDDLAFLDKQIEKVQTSHGRRVEGTGTGYRTVINGILLAKPTPREPQKDTRAAAALQAKLKKAQGDRTAKPKNKKK